MSIRTELSENMAVMHAQQSRALVKPTENKQAMRAEINRHVEEFISRGGRVDVCEIRIDKPGRAVVSNFAIQCRSDGALSETDAAKYLHMPRSTLAMLCRKDAGPKSVVRKDPENGRLIRLYQIPALDEWKAGMIERGEWKWSE